MGPTANIPPQTARAWAMLKIAEELVGVDGTSAKQVDIVFRERGASRQSFRFSDEDSPDGIGAVVREEASLGIANPAVLTTLAVRGVPPFRGEQPIRAIGVLPSPDCLVVAISPKTGLSSLEEVAAKRYPLRLSVRGQRNNSIHLVTDHVLQAAGWSLGDLIDWGGAVSFEDQLPSRGRRLAMAAAGEVDAVIDEGAQTWVDSAPGAGLQVVDLGPSTIERLVAWGYRRGTLLQSRFHSLPHDIDTIDFSGFAFYVHAHAPDDLVAAICAALDKRSDDILLQTGTPISIADMVGGGEAAPLGIPFHPAAEEYWRSRGYLSPTPPNE